MEPKTVEKIERKEVHDEWEEEEKDDNDDDEKEVQ